MQRRTSAGHGNAGGVDYDEEPERTWKSLVWGTRAPHGQESQASPFNSSSAAHLRSALGGKCQPLTGKRMPSISPPGFPLWEAPTLLPLYSLRESSQKTSSASHHLPTQLSETRVRGKRVLGSARPSKALRSQALLTGWGSRATRDPPGSLQWNLTPAQQKNSTV